MPSVELIKEYVNICRCLGGWTDWVQGAGGNCSIKDGNNLIIKRSGARIADTTATNGWVVCDLSAVKQCIINNNEDVTATILEGDGKPSIETFIHALDARIIVHLHPYPLFDYLCSDSLLENTDTFRYVDYYKPGLQLAKALQEIYISSIDIYFLKQHGIVLLGNTFESIINKMKYVMETLTSKTYITDISMCYSLYNHILCKYDRSLIIKTFSYSSIKTCERIIFPYTPDILVFLQSAPLFIEASSDNPVALLDKYISKYQMMPTVIYKHGVIYILANTLIGCYDIQEILIAYFNISSKCKYLEDDEINEIVHWDKEKERKAMN